MNEKVKKKRKKKKKELYLAAPFFNDGEWKLVDTLKLLCEGFGYKVFSPKDELLVTPESSMEERQAAFDGNTQAIDRADLVLAVIDDFDPGTIFEMGHAYAKGVPILAYSNVMGRGLNLMLAQSCIGFANGIEDLKEHLGKIVKGNYKPYVWTKEVI